MILNWKGKEVLEKMTVAAGLGIDRTMAKAVEHAKHYHPWHSRTGHLEGSIMIIQQAELAGTRVGGKWGARAGYSLFVEVGTSRIGPTAVERVVESPGMWEVPPPQPPPGVPVTVSYGVYSPRAGALVRRGMPTTMYGPLMAALPYLRPATEEYLLLAERIGAAFRGVQMP